MWDDTDDAALPDASFGLSALEASAPAGEVAPRIAGLGPLADDVVVDDGADPELLDVFDSTIGASADHVSAQAVAEQIFEAQRRQLYGDYGDLAPDLTGLLDF